MKYKKTVSGTFLSRPNRFIAKVKIGDSVETVHVKNTGRCRELLIEGCRVYLEESDNPNRKTRYDLIAVEKQRENGRKLLINMDSMAPNAAAAEWLSGGLFRKKAEIKREVTYGDSRFDFYIEDGEEKAFLEVKGVTLENNGIALFPDAPTDRGIKHINGLIKAKEDRYKAYILFVIQMKEVTAFTANDVTHKAFGEALRKARKSGVEILAYNCRVTPDTMEIDLPVKVITD